ncbi:MAG: hypothetical protein ABH800_00860 [Candidatus Nealsonbacteria bacterium]
MKSKWYELKEKAIELRRQGFSFNKIEYCLGVPRSTLSGWLKNIELTVEQKNKLAQSKKIALMKARKKAILWHNAQKEKRVQEAKNSALKILNNIDLNNPNILELALSILYIGEGTKKTEETAIGSSDPLILKFFLAVLKNTYNIDSEKIKCDLSLRADQNPEKMKRFWAKELKLPISNFKRAHLDERTKGSKTYPYYKGVCQIRIGNVAIQRKLIYISNIFCEKVIDNNSGAWRRG